MTFWDTDEDLFDIYVQDFHLRHSQWMNLWSGNQSVEDEFGKLDASASSDSAQSPQS